MNKKSQLKSHSLKKHDVRIILTETKLRSQFNIKDDANKEHKHDLVYYSRFPSTNCTDSNIEETARRLGEVSWIKLLEIQSRRSLYNS